MHWQPALARGTNKHNLALAGALVIMLPIATLTALTLSPAASASGATVDGLNVSEVNKTIDGNVTNIRLDSRLSYSHEVKDATRRIVKLQVGPSEGELETVDFRQTSDVSGDESGALDLSASVLDAESFTASDFDPAIAGTETTDVVVRAVIEVRRANGDPVTESVTKTVSVRLHDGEELTVAVGGSVDVVVETDA